MKFHAFPWLFRWGFPQGPRPRSPLEVRFGWSRVSGLGASTEEVDWWSTTAWMPTSCVARRRQKIMKHMPLVDMDNKYISISRSMCIYIYIISHIQMYYDMYKEDRFWIVSGKRQDFRGGCSCWTVSFGVSFNGWHSLFNLSQFAIENASFIVIIVDLPWIKMAIFHRNVGLPEGNPSCGKVSRKNDANTVEQTQLEKAEVQILRFSSETSLAEHWCYMLHLGVLMSPS